MIVRELVHIIGFRINEAQLGNVQNRVRQLGSLMSFVVTFPIALIGKSFVEASLNMDQLRLAIETYSTSMEEANRVTEELKDLAVSLPTVQVKDLNETVGNLLARGIEAKDLVDTFRTFAVITGATGGDLKRLTKAYTDTLGKGKLAGQEFNQYINASVPLRKALSQMLGKSVGELMVMQKKGLITFEVVRDALKGMAAEGGQFATIMGKKADLLWGKWQKFLDQLYYFKDELGKKLEVPLKVILDLFSKILDVLRKLDGNWKRFIIIGLGVMAIAGPLLMIYGILKMFIGPIGIVVAAIGMISLLVDDIYVWVAGGKSIMGELFGDYDKYKPAIDQLKELVKGTLENLKDILKNIFVTLYDIFSLFGEKKEYNALTVLLGLLSGILAVIYDLTAAVRIFGIVLSKPFMSEANFKKLKEDIIRDVSGSNTILGSITKAGIKTGEFKAGLLEKFQSFIRRNVPSMEIDQLRSDIAKYGLSPALFGGGAPGFTNAYSTDQFGKPIRSGNVYGADTVNIYVNPSIGPNTQRLGPTIQKAVEDSLKSVARDIKTNLSGKE